MTETIGARIERLAKEKRQQTLSQFVDDVGVSYETARKWVKDETAPNRKRVAKISELLGVSQEVIMFGESRPDMLGVREGKPTYVVELKSLPPDLLIAQAIHHLADYLAGMDLTTRELVATMLPKLALKPDSSAEVAALISRLASTQAGGSPSENVESIAVARTQSKGRKDESQSSRLVTNSPKPAKHRKTSE